MSDKLAKQTFVSLWRGGLGVDRDGGGKNPNVVVTCRSMNYRSKLILRSDFSSVKFGSLVFKNVNFQIENFISWFCGSRTSILYLFVQLVIFSICFHLG